MFLDFVQNAKGDKITLRIIEEQDRDDMLQLFSRTHMRKVTFDGRPSNRSVDSINVFLQTSEPPHRIRRSQGRRHEGSHKL